MRVFSYSVPSQSAKAGYCMVTDRFLVAVDQTFGEEAVLELWDTLNDSGGALEDALTMFAKRGIASLPSFAVIELVDPGTGSITLAVRGSGRVELLGASESSYTGDGVATWVEGSAQRVRRLLVGTSPARREMSTLPLRRGVVRSNHVFWGAPFPTPGAEEEPESEVPAWAFSTVGGPSADVGTLSSTAALDLSDSETILMSRRAARPAPAVEEPDDATLLGSRRSAEAFVLRLPGPRTVPLSGATVVGRAPRPEAHPDATVQRLLSPNKEVSGTHAELVLRGDTLLVRDLDSTNGTIVCAPGGEPTVLRGGDAVPLPLGGTVDFGDGNLATFDRS